MIAPGTYAILAPLMGGFLVGPRFLMGMLAGSITSGCMLAIMVCLLFLFVAVVFLNSRLHPPFFYY